MPRGAAESRVPPARALRAGAVAPVAVRVLLIALGAALLVYLSGGHEGVWLALPCVLVAASLARTPGGVFGAAAGVLLAGVLGAQAAPDGGVPRLWLLVLVTLASVLVLDSGGRRLQRERDVMERAAFSDPLTELWNRRMLRVVADYEIARHHRSGVRFVCVMLDLDGFKSLNDRFGHAAGDQMLCDVADALTRVLRSQDTVARLGGDEFCVIAPETENPSALADKVVRAVAGAASGYDGLSTSLGFSVFPDDGTEIDTLLELADERLLAAKRSLYRQSRVQPRRRRRAA